MSHFTLNPGVLSWYYCIWYGVDVLLGSCLSMLLLYSCTVCTNSKCEANICEDLVSLIKCILKKRSLITFILRQLLKKKCERYRASFTFAQKTKQKRLSDALNYSGFSGRFCLLSWALVCLFVCDSEILCMRCAVNPLCLSGFPLISERELTLAQVSCAGPWD